MLILERAEVVRRLESRGLVEIADSRDVGDVELTRLVNLLDRLATMEAAVRAADRLLDGRTFAVDDPLALAMVAALRLLKSEES